VAALTDGKAHIIAADKHRHKVEEMHERFFTLGMTNAEAILADAAAFKAEYAAHFDCVIADVPCSGLGVIGRKPDILLTLNEADLNELVQLQRIILANVSRYVKPGGMLIYATCTINPAENDAIVADFLAASDNFALGGITLPPRTAEAGIVCTDSVLKMYPHTGAGDGFYIAKMIKTK
jgi:16S rRNA (cytosine967-C5)-methyltransferase